MVESPLNLQGGGFDKDQLVIYKLGQIESKIEALISSVGVHAEQVSNELKDHDKRLTDLENANHNRNVERAKVAGFTGAIIFLAGFFKEVIEKWVLTLSN